MKRFQFALPAVAGILAALGGIAYAQPPDIDPDVLLIEELIRERREAEDVAEWATEIAEEWNLAAALVEAVGWKAETTADIPAVRSKALHHAGYLMHTVDPPTSQEVLEIVGPLESIRSARSRMDTLASPGEGSI